MLEAVAQQPSSVLVPTTERPAGYEVKQVLGQVFGVVVRSRGLGGNIMAGLRPLGGGDVGGYPRVGQDTPRPPIDRRAENPRTMSANAASTIRFAPSAMGQP